MLFSPYGNSRKKFTLEETMIDFSPPLFSPSTEEQEYAKNFSITAQDEMTLHSFIEIENGM